MVIYIKDKISLFVDFDGTLVNSIKKVVELYDQDYSSHDNYKNVHWTSIDSWDFKELKLLNKEDVDNYFCDIRFFQNLEYMDSAYEVINRLKDCFDIYIVSMGLTVNLALKNTWLKKNLPFVKFIGCNFNDVKDKSHIDMINGILIDDVAENLDSSNCFEKIVFGDTYPWNADSKYTRMYNWTDLEKYLMKKYKYNE
jgi:5'(3')-deoxyribonucleotidase